MAEEENPFKPKHSLPAGEPEPAVAPAPSGGKTVDEIKAEKAAKLAEEEAKAKAALAAAAAEYSKDCLLFTYDSAAAVQCLDLGGGRILKKSPGGALFIEKH